MCKACRQRSIWARIKLLSLISVAKPFDSASHSSRIKEENVSSLLQTWVPSFYQSFLENLSIFLVIFNQPDTHAYRFVDQFLKNISLRSCELTKLSILMINFVLSRAFEKLFFSFSLRFAHLHSQRQGWEFCPRFFSLSRPSFKIFFQPQDLDFYAQLSNGLRILTLFLNLSRGIFKSGFWQNLAQKKTETLKQRSGQILGHATP